MNQGKFTASNEVRRDSLKWGELAWLSGSRGSDAKNLVVIEVTFFPGQGHGFHKHPCQEEVLYIIEGSVEQWLGEERRLLGSGDSAFIPADAVHASFNTTQSKARLLAILGPCVGPDGYELVDVADQEPWNSLR